MGVFRVFLCIVMSIAFAGHLAAETLPSPKDKPVLTVSGKIKNTNVNGTAQFDRAMLEEMGLTVVETQTPWFTGRARFEGVLMTKLMEAVGAEGETITAIALNDYISTIPVSDFSRFNVILAMKRDGQYMPVRDKGPLFIIYPYDSEPELQSQTYYTRSAWQVAKLVVE